MSVSRKAVNQGSRQLGGSGSPLGKAHFCIKHLCVEEGFVTHSKCEIYLDQKVSVRVRGDKADLTDPQPVLISPICSCHVTGN